ncbi:hypothetical protein CDL15_Pgr016264 [Punica granatum]|uniref:Uncharacterized protein n=1 Tax=Punica granatum TaxID=22663 RepID=A0A218X1M9_PUNGR|nr:hypothetical protein CDL15_Pgr016264 [Punica granatum]
MARYRSRSRSYSPQRGSRTPPRSRKLNEDDPRVRRSYRERRSPAPSGLLLRNLPLNTRFPSSPSNYMCLVAWIVWNKLKLFNLLT